MSDRALDLPGPRLRDSSHRVLACGLPLAARDEKRLCAASGCDTVLSRYNLDSVCSLHGGWHREPAAPRRRRTAERS
jgi:hypothetical protein